MSALDSYKEFRPGDIVFIGKPDKLDRKNTWKILGLYTDVEETAMATLSSGRTERLRTVPASRLRPFRVVESA